MISAKKTKLIQIPYVFSVIFCRKKFDRGLVSSGVIQEWIGIGHAGASTFSRLGLGLAMSTF